MLGLALALAVAGCDKHDDAKAKAAAAGEPAPAGKAVEAKAAEPVEPAPPPVATDPEMKQLLAKGTACARGPSGLPLDCPEYKAVGDYAFQHQGSEQVAATCAGFLGDADASKRLLAAACLDRLNARTATTQLGRALDAIEHEQDPVVREQIAWAIKNAEAVTAKLDDRVIATVNRLAADPASERAAGYLFGTLFPQYLMGRGPKPPPAAQALALEALGRDGSSMQRAALNAVRLLDDQPAACAALGKAIRPDAKRWGEAAAALADVGAACAADAPKVVDFALERLAAGDVAFEAFEKLDRAFDLGAPTRAKIAKALKRARPKLPEWQRSRADKAAAAFAAPRKPAAK